MALIYDSDAYSRKSRRHGTSGRKRTTTSYDKYGYQLANMSSDSYSRSDSVMHVLRVRPGVVVNFIEPQSHSSRSRARTSSHVESSHRSGHTDSKHRYGHSDSRRHATDDERESAWEMTHSPHPRALELFDNGQPCHPFGFVEAQHPPPPPEPFPIVRQPTPFPHTPHPPEPHYHPPPPEPLPIARRSTPSPPSAHFVAEPHYPSPPHDQLSVARRATPSPNPHFAPELQHPNQPHERGQEHFAPDMQHQFSQPRERGRESSAPIDIPMHSRSSDFTSQSLSSISSMSESPPGRYDQAVQPYYYAPRHKPIDIPVQISSGRNLSRSFDYPSHGTPHSSESNSPPSTTRSVRFNDDPVQPSPSPVVRRKGWWNRRGDQLWDNDGSYAQASEQDKYPLDLHNYPEPGVGWMNEEGVQIDMKRRIIRKKPLRSALKKSSSL